MIGFDHISVDTYSIHCIMYM